MALSGRQKMQKNSLDHDCPLCKALEEEFDGEPWEEFDLEEDELDRDSNHVIDLLVVGQLDAAEAAACELMKKYPDAIDGLDRLARVYEAKGDFARAIQYYENAIAFTRVNAGFDEEGRDDYKQRISELKARLA
jgi:tetratricopeptide (TPR) repeat protein